MGISLLSVTTVAAPPDKSGRRYRCMRRVITLLSLMLAAPAYAADDVVTTKSGVRLVGEIKQLEQDVLTFATDFSDSDFAIKQDEILSLESSRQFLVETIRGQRLSGSLAPDPGGSAVVVVGGQTIALADISTLQPFERSLWSRFDSSLDFGYSVVKANKATQLTFGGNVSYRGQRNVDSTFVNLFRNSQSNAPSTNRFEIGNDYRYLLGERWYLTAAQDFLQSDEQALDLRMTLGGGVGRYLTRSSDQYLGVGAGVAWTREDYQDPSIEIQKSGEIYLGSELMTKKLRFADVLTRLTYYPSLTVDDRYRLSYKFDMDFNLPGDWYFRVSLFDNYDSRPPSASLARNDWGWSNSFGLKF